MSTSVTVPAMRLSAEDKMTLSEYLKSTRSNLLAAVSGLTKEQWEFKPSEEVWSILEVFEHITIVEGFVHMRIEAVASAAADDENRAVREMDDLIIAEVPQRNEKFQAPPPSHPTGEFTGEELIRRFYDRRERTLTLLDTAPHLRGRVTPHPIFGPWDGYQWILGGAAHSARHTAQVLEVKDHPDFPKSDVQLMA